MSALRKSSLAQWTGLKQSLLPCLILALWAGCGEKHTPVAGIVLEDWGVHVIVFETPSGEIRILLPNPLRGGESVSGTVERKPTGDNDTAVAANNLELNRYEFATSGGTLLLKGEIIQWAVPTEAVGALISLTDRRKELGRVFLPVDTTKADNEVPRTFRFPSATEAGLKIVINGPFDGDLTNSTVNFGGKTAHKLAESSTALVVVVPMKLAGSVEIEIEDGKVRSMGNLNCLQLRLSAGRTELSEGEWTDLTVQVTGLSGVPDPLSLRVQNNTPTVARFGSIESNLIWRVIRPGDTETGGIFTLNEELVGLTKGPFTIEATVGLAGARHSNVYSGRPAHDWEKSSLPTHTPYDSRRTWHSDGISKLKPHGPARSSLPDHDSPLSKRAVSTRYPDSTVVHNGPISYHHKRAISWRLPHKEKMSDRPVHSRALSRSSQPAHDDTLSSFPKHGARLSKSSRLGLYFRTKK